MPAGAGTAAIGMSNVGFLLSFVDDATPHLKRVTSAYRQLTASMDEAYKKANQTGMFTGGLDRIINKMEQYVEIGHQAVGLMASFSQLSRGKFGKVEVDVKLRRLPKLVPLEKGAIVNKPTHALIGEAGPEMVVPLGKKKNRDFWKWALPQLLPMAHGAIPGGGLGATALRMGMRNMRGMHEGGEGLEQVSEVARSLKSEYADMETHISSMVDLTKKLREHFGQTRDEMLQTRKALITSFDGASYDIERTFENMYDLRKESELTEQDAIKLSKTLGLVEDFQGANLSKFAKDLSFYTEMAADDVNQLVLDMSEGFRDAEKTTGITIGLSNITEYLEKAADISKSMTGIWKPEEMGKAIKSMAAMGAGMYNAGLDADLLNEVIKEVNFGSFEAKVALQRFGLSAEFVNKKLAEGDPGAVMEKLANLGEATKGNTLAATQMRSVYSQIFNVSEETLIDLAARGKKGKQATDQLAHSLGKATGRYEALNKANMKSKSLWQQINIQVTRFTKTLPLINNIVNALEGLLPMLESIFFGLSLFRMSGVSKLFSGFFKGVGKAGEAGLVTKMLFGKGGKKGLKGALNSFFESMVKPRKFFGKKGSISLSTYDKEYERIFGKVGKKSAGAFAKSFKASSKFTGGLFTGLFKSMPWMKGLFSWIPKLFKLLKLGGVIGLIMTLADFFVVAYKNSLPFRIALEQLRLSFMQLWDTITKFMADTFGKGAMGDNFKWLGDSLTWFASLVSTGVVQVLDILVVALKAVAGTIISIVKIIGSAASLIGGVIGLVSGQITPKEFGRLMGGEMKDIGNVWTGLFGKKEVDVQAVRADMGKSAVVKEQGKDVLVNVDMSGVEKRVDALRKVNQQQLDLQKKKKSGGVTSGGVPLASLGVSYW
jgi:hypothetical protein